MNDEEIENALKCLEMDMLDNTQIELLLNYIDKLQKENQELEKIIEQSLVEQKERDKYTHELEQRLDKLQKENKESKELYNKLLIGYNKLVQEYLELEKIIDLMAEHISKYGKVCTFNYGATRPEQWIEYFTKKVDEENE